MMPNRRRVQKNPAKQIVKRSLMERAGEAGNVIAHTMHSTRPRIVPPWKFACMRHGAWVSKLKNYGATGARSGHVAWPWGTILGRLTQPQLFGAVL